METEYDKELSEIEGLEMCESCAWAEWDCGDVSVGLGAYVEDCNAEMKGTKPRDKYEDNDHIPPHYCPWYSKQFPRENERIRCKNCNSPKWKVTKDIYSPNTEEYEVWECEITCKDCGETQIRDCMDVGYAVNE